MPNDDIGACNKDDYLSIPKRHLLDELIREYFLHVHPNLPVIDEADFWDTYNGTITSSISVMCLHAMMFAACSVCVSATNQVL
jgi:hypothetical protein